MNKTSETISESCLSCQNIGKILIWMILVVSKNPISLIFQGPQTLHITTIFEKILQIHNPISCKQKCLSHNGYNL